MSENMYINLAKADLIQSLNKRNIFKEEFEYLVRQISDKDFAHELIFDIYRNLNKNIYYNNIEDIIINEKATVFKIVSLVREVCKIDMNIDFYTDMWLYCIFIKQNNNVSYKEREVYLSGISSFSNVSRFFLLEYYNSLLDNVIGSDPIDFDRLEELKIIIRKMI